MTSKSDFDSDVLYSQLRYQALLVQTAPHPNCTPVIGLMTKKGERCGKQAVVTGALFNVKCHRVCVFVSLSMPINRLKRSDIRGLNPDYTIQLCYIYIMNDVP